MPNTRHIALYPFTRVWHRAISLHDQPFGTGFFLLGLDSLELCEGLHAVLLREDPQYFVDLLQQPSELGGEALVYHRIQLLANEEVRVGEENSPDEVVA